MLKPARAPCCPLSARVSQQWGGTSALAGYAPQAALEREAWGAALARASGEKVGDTRLIIPVHFAVLHCNTCNPAGAG